MASSGAAGAGASSAGSAPVATAALPGAPPITDGGRADRADEAEDRFDELLPCTADSVAMDQFSVRFTFTTPFDYVTVKVTGQYCSDDGTPMEVQVLSASPPQGRLVKPSNKDGYVQYLLAKETKPGAPGKRSFLELVHGLQDESQSSGLEYYPDDPASHPDQMRNGLTLRSTITGAFPFADVFDRAAPEDVLPVSFKVLFPRFGKLEGDKSSIVCFRTHTWDPEPPLLSIFERAPSSLSPKREGDNRIYLGFLKKTIDMEKKTMVVLRDADGLKLVGHTRSLLQLGTAADAVPYEQQLKNMTVWQPYTQTLRQTLYKYVCDHTIRGLRIIDLLVHIRTCAASPVAVAIVGGAVRDAFRGKSFSDIDLAVGMEYGQLKAAVLDFFAGRGESLDETTLQSHSGVEKFGMMKILKAVGDDDDLDIGVFKAGKHEGELYYGFSYELDAAFRDYTMSAIYFDVFGGDSQHFGRIIDPFRSPSRPGGWEDLCQSRLKIATKRLDVFVDDYGGRFRLFKMLTKRNPDESPVYEISSDVLTTVSAVTLLHLDHLLTKLDDDEFVAHTDAVARKLTKKLFTWDQWDKTLPRACARANELQAAVPSPSSEAHEGQEGQEEHKGEPEETLAQSSWRMVCFFAQQVLNSDRHLQIVEAGDQRTITVLAALSELAPLQRPSLPAAPVLDATFDQFRMADEERNLDTLEAKVRACVDKLADWSGSRKRGAEGGTGEERSRTRSRHET